MCYFQRVFYLILRFSKKTTKRTPKPLPPGLNYSKLFPEYKISEYQNSTRKLLKGTNIIVTRKKLRNEYYSNAKDYPWIKTIAFSLISKDKKEYYLSSRDCKKHIGNTGY